jgi:hypothetical protein
MLSPLKQVGKKLKTLITNIVVDNGFVEATKANLVRYVILIQIWACHV